MKSKVALLSAPPRAFELQGRLGWTMVQFFNAEPPNPGWSTSAHNPCKLGIQMEPHEGTYPGHHAHNRLAYDVLVAIFENEVGAMRHKHPKPPPIAVRPIMRKHGLPEPSAGFYGRLAYGEAALHG
ncbi:hypothetical protein ACGYJ8_13845 [Sulfitobacter sp. 1A12126]|uniref:hypothetical protein n=1 Tax=Sulfitobacter sp. 1A12126 TaxID=3368591 RepID=UPI003745DDE2